MNNNKSIAWKNFHNLERARDHFRLRAESIREMFEFDIWAYNGLNWPDWENEIVRMICHVYGVRSVYQIAEDELDAANDFAVDLIDKLFDENIKHMQKERDRNDNNRSN